MIHPTAIVHPQARIAADAQIGPYCVIGPQVSLGARCWIGSHSVIEGLTEIGPDNRIHPFCSIGSPPQDKKYAGEATRLVIGAGNTIREFCSFSTGTTQDAGITQVGERNWIMAYVHIAHDCQIGNDTILANNTQLAGHVHVDDFAVLGGFTGVHQFVRIGAHCMIGGGTMLRQDVPPYVMAEGNPAAARGINSEGLKRRGFSAEAIGAVREAFKTLYRNGLTLEQARQALADSAREHPQIAPLLAFLQNARRGIVR
jgi:UDP-N-acetylglucosamine acyltransferase